MVLVNVESIVAADQTDGEERLLILYNSPILVARTVTRTSSASISCFSPHLYTRLATKNDHVKPTSLDNATGKALQEGPSRHKNHLGSGRGILSHATES